MNPVRSRDRSYNFFKPIDKMSYYYKLNNLCKSLDRDLLLTG